MFLSVLVFLTLVIAGCSKKSQDDILTSLDQKVSEMKGYKTHGVMTLYSGEKPQKYHVEVWHKKPEYYRVKLTNDENEQSQMIIRNKDGVFVLTPALNKSFRFQSDWPESSSQVYLYESIIRDLLIDEKRTFKEDKKSFIFETKTNYQNRQFHSQVITFAENLAPKKVQVLDVDQKTMIDLTFEKFQFDPSFDANSFDVERNMTGGQMTVPVFAKSLDEKNKKFPVLYPVYEIEGATLENEQELHTEDGIQVVLTYGGSKGFTLIEKQSTVQKAMKSVDMVNAEPIDLGVAIGSLTENSISWTHNGIDFFLASDRLSEEELIMVAQSVYGKAMK